jgi:glycosyltransferase involved in cell wall biosynthesis
MQRINICYVITKSNFGGAQKYVYELATSLPTDRFAVTVALGGEGILKEKLDAAGIRTVIIPHLVRDISIFNEFRVFGFLYHFFNDEHFDIVHLNSSKIGGLGGLAARIAGIPRIIFSAHGFAFNEQVSWLKKALIKLSYWVMMMLADTTIAVSNAVKEQVHGWPFLYKRITVIANGIRPVHFLETSDARTKLVAQFPTLDIHQKWIGTIAELHPVKGLDILISAAKAVHATHPNYQFVVIGEGDARSTLEAQIRAEGLEKSFILLGFLDNAATYLPAFEAFVLPSRSEALGLVLLEAGLASLPVVATKVGGIPEVITHGKTGLLVPSADAHALQEAIVQLISNTEKSKTLAHNLHELVRGNYMHDTMLEKTIGLYYR